MGTMDENRRYSDMDAAGRNAIQSLLEGTYIAVYLVDLEHDRYQIYKEPNTMLQGLLREDRCWSATLKAFASECDPSQYEDIVHTGDVGLLRRVLKESPVMECPYRYMGEKMVWRRARFQAVEWVDGMPSKALVTLVPVDDRQGQIMSLGWQVMDQSKELRENRSVISSLGLEYTSVWLVHVPDMRCRFFQMVMGTEVARECIEYSQGTMYYAKLFKYYVDTFVAPEERSRIYREVTYSHVRKKLASGDIYRIEYLCRHSGKEEYYQAIFTRAYDGDSEDFLIGFRNVDALVRQQKKDEAQKNRSVGVIRKLSREYAFVGCVDPVTLEEIIYRQDFGNVERKGWRDVKNFSERMDFMAENVLHPEDRRMFLEATRMPVIKKELSENEAYFVNFREVRGDIVQYWQAKFVMTESEPKQLIVAFRNYDDETKKRLAEKDAAEAANRAKTAFLFNMSHDIRTPMNAIIGFQRLARKSLKNPEKLLDCLDKLESSSNHLLRLINDVLDMARIESGKLCLEEEPVNLSDMMETMQSMMQPMAEAKSITYMQEMRIKHFVVHADLIHLNQIVINILSNAIKYTQKGGVVSYLLEELPEEDGRAVYRHTVTDNGIGMTKEFAKDIYEAFARENNTVVNGIQGTGLGMAIVKRLVDLLGGTINIDTALGKGTSVKIELPFRFAENTLLPEKEAAVENAEEMLSGLKVLLVEDNGLNREIAREILEDFGVLVDEVEDGVSAVECLQRASAGQYDVVLMDIQMPRMDGYQATREIRRMNRPAVSDIPIIAMTANVFEEDKKKAKEAGMNGHMGKPVEVEELIHLLRKYKMK